MSTQPISPSVVPAPQVLATEVSAGRMSLTAFTFFQNVVTALLAIVPAVNGAFGVINFTLATQPFLTPANAGYTALVTDYGHVVVWTGTRWQFAPGDAGNGYYVTFGIAPTAPGWSPADGTATTYLTVGGATLTTTPFTTLVIGNAWFRR